MKEKARVEDALHATRAAVEEGIVPSSGVALIRGQKALEGIKVTEEQKAGIRILDRAIEEPPRQIVGNADEEGSIAPARTPTSSLTDGTLLSLQVAPPQGRAVRPLRLPL